MKPLYLQSMKKCIFNIAISNYCLSNEFRCINCKLYVSGIRSVDDSIHKGCVFAIIDPYNIDIDAIKQVLNELPILKHIILCDFKCKDCKYSVTYLSSYTPFVHSMCRLFNPTMRSFMLAIGKKVFL